MVVRGRARNGVVVLEGGTRLPEGQEVTVVASSPRQGGHGVLDMRPERLGAVVSSAPGEDRLEEMLEGRR